MSLWGRPDLSAMRVSYDGGRLLEKDLAATPLAQFERWLGQMLDAGLPEPNAMVLGTVADGDATGRTVLLKGADTEGFRFYTNHTSAKAAAIASAPRASLVFPWFALHRQVCVSGRVERVPVAEAEEYFRSRPRGSQLAAWASHQSTELTGRDELEGRFEELERRWPEGTEVPFPDFWGGYLVRPSYVEFWHGRVSRLHDRLRFVAQTDPPDLGDPDGWRVVRLAP